MTPSQAGSLRPVDQKRELEIPSSISRIEKEVECLSHIVAELESRIRPCLRIEPAEPKCPTAKCESEPFSGTVYESIHRASNAVQSNRHKLEEVLRLLEI